MILITGASGGLGSELVKVAQDYWAPTRKELDLDRPRDVFEIVMESKPDFVFHLAGLTDVDACEKDREKALRVNWLSTRAVARASARLGATLVFLSTDYVFSGQGSFYREHHRPDPLNFYGLSKLMAEGEVLSWHKAYVIRTSWVFGPAGRNFLSRFLDIAQQNKRITAINDQFSTPTYAPWLAQRLWTLVSKGPVPGLYHLAGQTDASYFELARAGVEMAGMDCEVVPVSGQDIKRPARRPVNSSLSSWAWQQMGGQAIPGWQAALKEFVAWWKKARSSEGRSPEA